MRWLITVAAVAFASCDYRSGPLPSQAEVMRVEQTLFRSPCIGGVNGWERSFRYQLKPNSFAVFLSKLDRDVIDFKLLRAGKFARAALTRLPPYPPVAYEADSTPTDIAWGSYNLRSGKREVQHCGSNVPQ